VSVARRRPQSDQARSRIGERLIEPYVSERVSWAIVTIRLCASTRIRRLVMSTRNVQPDLGKDYVPGSYQEASLRS